MTRVRAQSSVSEIEGCFSSSSDRNDRTMRASGYPQFDIRPEGRRDEYWVIDFVENEGVFGLDIRLVESG